MVTAQQPQNMKSLKNTQSLNLTSYFLFIILILGIVGLQTIQSYKLPYTPNEDWSVYGTPHSRQTNLIFTTDNLPLDIWIQLFGDTPIVTRYLSILFNVLCFAFVFRLGTDQWGEMLH